MDDFWKCTHTLAKMTQDEHIREEIWKGRVPIVISLYNQDCDKLTLPIPYNIMAPRISYFPLLSEMIHKYFDNYLTQMSAKEDMWFDYQGTPLKWNLCIGLLYDMHAYSDNIPWPLTVHFSAYPDKLVQRCLGLGAVESLFLSSLKEADALKHRGQIMSNLQKHEHLQLWEGLSNDRYDQFWAINRKLMKLNSDDGFMNIPFKLYINKQPPLQRLQKPFAEDGTAVTLENLIDSFVPGVTEDTKVLIQGIEPSMSCSLQWLSETFVYPDNFLHICVETQNIVPSEF